MQSVSVVDATLRGVLLPREAELATELAQCTAHLVAERRRLMHEVLRCMHRCVTRKLSGRTDSTA